MKGLKFFILLFPLFGLVSGCMYENYIEDYDYTGVYFGTQKPLRTIVARESNTMQIKFGVALGGVRENSKDHWVKFRLDPGLLQTVPGASAYTMLPDAYYSMILPFGDSTFIIPSGKTIGDLVLSINKSEFTSDPFATTKYYALPIRIYETSADSILKGNEIVSAKDYTIIVIKYIDEKSGTYYVKGVETDNTTNISTTYSFSDLIKNKTRDLSTLSLDRIEMGGLGTRNASSLFKLLITLNVDKSVSISTAIGGVTVVDMGSSYDVVNKIFNLKYSYVFDNKMYTVDEQIIQRQDPELDLRFEEW